METKTTYSDGEEMSPPRVFCPCLPYSKQQKVLHRLYNTIKTVQQLKQKKEQTERHDIMFIYEERRDVKGMWMGMQGRRLVYNTPDCNQPPAVLFF